MSGFFSFLFSWYGVVSAIFIDVYLISLIGKMHLPAIYVRVILKVCGARGMVSEKFGTLQGNHCWNCQTSVSLAIVPRFYVCVSG